MRRTDGQSQWNSMAGNRGCSGRLRWFRGSMGFASPPHELQPELGRCLDPFWMPLFFFFALSKRGDDAGSNNGCWVSRLLPSPASLEPNRSIWDVGNKNLMDNVAPLSTMEWLPRIACLPRRGHRRCRRQCSATTSFGQDAMRTLRTLCGGGAFFFSLSVRLPWPNIPPPRCNAGCHGTNARRTHHHAPRPEPSWSG